MGPATVARWTDPETVAVGDVAFVSRPAPRFTSTPTRFCLVKRPELTRRHLDLLAALQPRRIVELGIFQGGSVALTALAARPDALAAFELATERVPALDVALEQAGLASRCHLAYGTDQADGAALRAGLARAGLDGELDLVVDDASHLLDRSRASFDVLFPLLRPGGTYVLEDWSWAHIGFGSHLPDERPLSEMVFELTLALPSVEGLIDTITIDRDRAVVVRGEGAVPPGFSLTTSYAQRGRDLLTAWSPTTGTGTGPDA